jgi:hypothetical protein
MAIVHESIHNRHLGIYAQKIPQKLDLALNTKNMPQPELFQKYSSNSPSFQPGSESATDVSTVLTPKILFAGDSMMQGIAPLAIAELRKKYPSGLFVDLSQQSTGLSVNRYFDWPAKIQEESLKHGFNIVVIFLGPNDPWDIYEGRVKYVFPSEAWREKYRSRIREIMEFSLLHKIHIIWIGLPNMGQERIKQGALIQNTLFYKNLSFNIQNNKHVYNSSSASIIKNPFNVDQFIINTRTVNYMLDPMGKQHHIGNFIGGCVGVTINKITVTDSDFNELSVNYVYPDNYVNKYVGIEDIRLFNFNDEIYFIVRPESFHPFYERILKKTMFVGKVKTFENIDCIEEA